MSERIETDLNSNLIEHYSVLEEIIRRNTLLMDILDRARLLGLPEYYIGAGCIAQTVWNFISGNDAWYGIKDIDFVYFDNENLDYEFEYEIIKKIKEVYQDIGIEVDVKNQARVHLWYKEHFGYDITPYTSLESAINTWPTTATAIGLKKEEDDSIKIYAPFGLNDLFGMVVRANKAQITKDIYMKKVESWLMKWPNLRIIEWEKE